jgi:SHS2 domain-containing protein
MSSLATQRSIGIDPATYSPIHVLTKKMYEVFAHTADLGLRVKAPDLNALFSEAGRGFFSVIVANLSDVRPLSLVEFDIKGRDLAYLFADWLNELLFAFESRRLLLCEFDVSVGDDGLHATAKGETIDESRHQLDHEVKAITYHGLNVREVDDGWAAEVILDI